MSRQKSITQPDYYERMKFATPKRKRRGTWLECKTCGRDFYVFPERLRRSVHVRFCSKACYKKHGTGWLNKSLTPAQRQKMLANLKLSKQRFKPGPENPNVKRFGRHYVGITPTWWRDFLLATIGSCERCGWNAEPRILQLHHKDRNRKRNCRENVELLCPICHELDHLAHHDGRYCPPVTMNAKNQERRRSQRLKKLARRK